ncbi:glycosyltransferase [Vibrio fortis]|uniref:glycosyltransferase n=1 Tax=Vibrio fortis TaxID=212667 RepID=UPI0036F22CC3
MNVNKISVITLTYNNAHLLSKAIESVSNQKVNSKHYVEYIILDDGSDNFNLECINDKLKECKFKSRVIVNESNMGTVKAFNRAINESSGDIIVPLSADDEFYDEHVLDSIATEFEKTNSLIITGLRVPVIAYQELAELPLPKHRKLFCNSRSLLKHMIYRSSIISGASTYYHKDIFKKIGYFDERYRLLEDLPFIFKALFNGYSIHLLQKKTIKYGTDGISSSLVVNPILKKDFTLCYSELCQYPVGFFSKRFVKYQRVMDCKNKTEIKNIILYPEQYLFFKLKKYRSGSQLT